MKEFVMEDSSKISEKVSTAKPTQTKGKAKQKKSKKSKSTIAGFAVLNRTCAGADIGAEEIFVAAPSSEEEIEVRSFSATTPGLKQSVQWLKSLGISSVAMEATGIYWVPFYEILADNGLTPCLVDPKSVKNVPCKKTDVLDCQWIQRLFACGLLRPAYVPKKPWMPLRSLLRQRDNLVRQSAKYELWMQKALILMNIRLDVVLSHTTTVTGVDIIRAIVKGERDPLKLVELRNTRCHKSAPDFIDALTGNFQKEHLFNLKMALEGYDKVAEELKAYDIQIEAEMEKLPKVSKESLAPSEKDKKKNRKYEQARKPKTNEFNFDMREALYRISGLDLQAIPGIGEHTFATIISELGGADVDAFPSEKAFCSWVALCPGQHVSGGKSRSGRGRKAQNRIKQALLQAASAVMRSKTALGSRARSFKNRLGKASGHKAIAHMLARLIYRLIKYGEAYVEEAEAAREEKLRQYRVKKLMKQAASMGLSLVPKDHVDAREKAECGVGAS